MDVARASSLIEQTWQDAIVPQLVEYIRIPNKSPLFDEDWQAHGYMDEAVDLIETWCRAQPLRGLNVEVVRLPGRTPLIYTEIPGDVDATVLLYGHLDKQPEMTGWREGLGPWKPVIEGDRLYGRGGADDGYAAFASLTAIRALQEQGVPHARCVVIIEACEESGSYDLPFYVEALAPMLVPILMVMMAAKFALVVMFFMHLKFDGPLLTGVFVWGLFIATAIILALMALFGKFGG